MTANIKTPTQIQAILSALYCKQIIDVLSSSHINKQDLLTLIINSKMGFDQLALDMSFLSFIEDLVDTHCYQENNYRDLVMSICTMDSNNQDSKSVEMLHSFYQFHSTIYKVALLAIKLFQAHSSSNTQNITKIIPIASAVRQYHLKVSS